MIFEKINSTGVESASCGMNESEAEQSDDVSLVVELTEDQEDSSILD